jgi:NADH dehydrogenase/NADH:ubiquinone oxidoreductase subunit G
LHPSLGSVGFSNFNNLKTIQNKDFKGANMIYLINNSFSTSNIKKLLNLKLLNYFQGYNLESNLLITQSSSLDTKSIGKLKKGFFLNTHLHLPNTVFFETSGTYINTLGNMNKLSRIIKPSGQTKDN